MNGPYFGEQINRNEPSDNIEGTTRDTLNREGYIDPLGDNLPADAEILSETPMGGTVAAVRPITEAPIDNLPVQSGLLVEVPMGGTIASAGPIDEEIVQTAPTEEMIVYDDMKDETIPYTAPVSEMPVDRSVLNAEIPYKSPMAEVSPIVANGIPLAALLNREESEHFRTRWNEIQGKFVDEPRVAVQQADALVSEVTEKITQIFTSEHGSLESQWKQGNEVSTEDLRKALQRYRSFFNRMVV